MKSFLLLGLLVGLSVSAHAQGAGTAAAPEPGVQRVTLYGPLARGHDASRALFSFKTGAYGRGWDLNYGSLYVSEEHDWFQVSTLPGARTAFRDLGAFDWADSFKVPVVEPFPKLKEGEQRTVKIDASGADGEDGAPGADAADWDGVVRPKPRPVPPPRRPKNDGVPKVDPVFVKAQVGHMYVIRVVDGDEDFYVLFRVESLVRGDNCTITWKRVPAPRAESAGMN
jgi:hypothetical protein